MARGRGRSSRGGSRGQRSGRNPDSGDRIRGDRNRSFRGKREEKVFTREEGDFQKSKFAGKRNRRGKRELTTNDLDKDLDKYWRGKDDDKQEIFKGKLDQDLDNYFKSS